jgi:beta-ketoacyl-acyl-carrier-protein synthase II
LGGNVQTFFDSLIAGRSGVGRITLFDPSPLSCQIAGEVKGFDPFQWIDPKVNDHLDRTSQFALAASAQAVAQAGVESAYDPYRCGVVLGTSMGGMNTLDHNFERLYRHGKGCRPLTIPKLMANAPASQVAMRYGYRGPCSATTTACASAASAMAVAMDLIRWGQADLVVSGGTEAMITFGVMKAWEALRLLAPAGDDPKTACRPFSADRAGLVIGEGAGVFVLEALDLAEKRGAPIICEIAGHGQTADAHHLTQPLAETEARAISLALEMGGLKPEQIGYINAHGTATQANDATETAALKLTLGEHAYRVPISSTKAAHGHTLGAAAAIELVATIKAMETGTVPPTLNLRVPDPECDLDYVPNTARPGLEIEAALSNSFAFGGINVVLAVRKYRGPSAASSLSA